MFKSVESALKWAAQQHAMVPVKGSAVSGMCGDPQRGTMNDLLIGLNAQERKDQAENILGMVFALDPACKELIMAEFCYEREDKHIKILMMRAFGSMGTGSHRRRGVRNIVLRYFGENIGLRQIRDDLHCKSNDVHKYIDRIFNLLDRIRAEALAELHVSFVEKNLIEDYRKTACV